MKAKMNSVSEDLLPVLGKVGALPILKELSRGPKRFSDLKQVATHATVAKRVKELERLNLIQRRIVNSRPPTTIYNITARGSEVLQILEKLRSLTG